MLTMSISGKPYHHGNLRTALVDAAVEILATDGLAGLTLRAVARHVGVSRQAPYNHFRDADDLVAAVAESSFDDLMGGLEEVWREDGGERVLQEMGVRYVRFAVTNPARFRVMFGRQLGRREKYPALAAAADRVFALLSRPAAASAPGLEQVQSSADRSGPIAPGDPRAVLWSVVHGLAYLLIDGQLTGSAADAEVAEAYARAVTASVWFGLASPESGRQDV
jgi:AcrR family transcriptional regulator